MAVQNATVLQTNNLDKEIGSGCPCWLSHESLCYLHSSAQGRWPTSLSTPILATTPSMIFLVVSGNLLRNYFYLFLGLPQVVAEGMGKSKGGRRPLEDEIDAVRILKSSAASRTQDSLWACGLHPQMHTQHWSRAFWLRLEGLSWDAHSTHNQQR